MPPGAYSLANFLFRVFDAKRLIGRKFSDPEVQADMKHFPFKIIDKAGKPYIQVQYRGETKEFVCGSDLSFYGADITDFVVP